VTGTLVVDASAALRLAVDGPGSAEVVAALATAEVLVAPSLYVAEVANALWKYVRAGLLDVATADANVNDLVELIGRFEEMDAGLASKALALAARFDHSAYDAIYAVTASENHAVLATVDTRLAALANHVGVATIPR